MINGTPYYLQGTVGRAPLANFSCRQPVFKAIRSKDLFASQKRGLDRASEYGEFVKENKSMTPRSRHK